MQRQVSGMDDLIWKIYNNIVREEKDVVDFIGKTDGEIQAGLVRYKACLTEEQYEQLKDLLYQTVDCGRQEGFRLGMRYAYKIAVASFEE